MKINPVSIQSYQQIAQRDRAAEQARALRSENQSLTIKPEKNSVTSALAIKVPGASYADSLSPEETQALEMLFGKYRGNDKFGAGYQTGSSSDEFGVGRVIDIKV